MLTLERTTIKTELASVKKRNLSVFFIALCLFCLLNYIFYSFDKKYVICDKTRNAHYFDFPSLRRICSTKNREQEIIFLGSSLFDQPFWALDKKIKAIENIDARHYHSVAYLTNKLQSPDKQDICSLAAGGALISDYFLLLNKHMSANKNMPNWIIIDCAPRAFYDSGLINPKETPIFDYFFEADDFYYLSQHYLPDINSQIEFITQYYCFMHRHRRWFTDILNNSAHNIYNRMFAKLSSSNQNIVANKISDPLAEYRGHYRGISNNKIEQQMKFISLIVNFCNEQNIKALFINMPLTDANKNLLEPGFYNYYRDCLLNILSMHRKNIHFLDLSNGNYFCNQDFEDSAHLNASGAKKLEDTIYNFITQH